VLLTLGWAKEFRLRRALQSLLARVFHQWRHANETHEPPAMRRDEPNAANPRRRRVR
jgi:hypothetical protein